MIPEEEDDEAPALEGVQPSDLEMLTAPESAPKPRKNYRPAMRATLHVTRALTVPGSRRLDDAEVKAGKLLQTPEGIERPRTRSECESLSECPWCLQQVSMRALAPEEIRRDRNGRETIRASDGARAERLQQERERDGSDVARALRLRKDQDGSGGEPEKRSDRELRLHQETPRDVRDSGIRRVVLNAGALREPQKEELPGLRRARHHGLRPLALVRELLCRHGAASDTGALPGPQEQQRQLRAGQLPVGNEDRADEEQTYVACPLCLRRVSFRRGVGRSRWSWAKYGEGASRERLVGRGRDHDAGDGGLSHCRPCVRTSCKHHLYLDVNPDTGSIKLNFPDLEVWELKETCSLDVADRGGETLEEVGEIMNLTRERVRQIEVRTCMTLKPICKDLGVDLLNLVQGGDRDMEPD